MSHSPMAQNLLLSLSLSLSLSLILSTLRRNSFKISESAPVYIKMPGLFYGNVQGSALQQNPKSKIRNPKGCFEMAKILIVDSVLKGGPK